MDRRTFLRFCLAFGVGGLMTTRVQLGKLPNGDYGLQVTSSDGSTVIIDGTSDMFAIVATGTISLPGCNGTGTVCTSDRNVTLTTGLTAAPAHVAFVELSGLAYPVPITSYVNHGGGGGVAQTGFNSYTQVVNTNQTLMNAGMGVFNADQSGLTVLVRYYLLRQVAF